MSTGTTPAFLPKVGKRSKQCPENIQRGREEGFAEDVGFENLDYDPYTLSFPYRNCTVMGTSSPRLERSPNRFEPAYSDHALPHRVHDHTHSQDAKFCPKE